MALLRRAVQASSTFHRSEAMQNRSCISLSRKPLVAGLVVLTALAAGGAWAAGQYPGARQTGAPADAAAAVDQDGPAGGQCASCAAGPRVYSIITLGGDEYWGAYLNQKGHVVAFGAERNRFFDGARWYDLGSLGGGYTFVRAMNDRGVVVGESLDASEPFGNVLAFSWTAMRGMRALQGLSVSSATAINNSNQIAGYTAAPGVSEQAVRWDPSGRTVNLGPVPFSLSQAMAINNGGESAGFTDLADGSIHATIWTAAGDLIDLGSLDNNGFASTQFLNERGDAAGESGNDGFFWSKRTGMIATGSHVASGIGHMVGLSDSGEIVGNTEVPGGRAAFVWTQAGGLRLLPRGSAIGTSVWGMNRRADMVGAVERAGDDFRAVRWHGFAIPVDLNGRLHRPPPGLVVTQGLAVNDRGDIVAYSNAGILLLRPGTTGTDAPVLGPVNGLPRVVRVADDLALTLGFVDSSPTQTHTVSVSWDDGCGDSSPPPSLLETGGTGQITFRHRFCRVGTAGVWVRITDSAGKTTEVLKQTYVDDPASLTLNGRGTLAAGRAGDARPVHFAFWVPLKANAASVASGIKAATPFLRLGGALRFDSEQVDSANSNGHVYSVAGNGRLNGRPGYRFRLEAADDAVQSDGGARIRLRVLHTAPGGNDVVDYDSLLRAPANTVGATGTGALSKAASGWVTLSR
jgi:hypothetical protein